MGEVLENHAVRKKLHILGLAIAGYLSIAVGGLGLGEPYAISRLMIATLLIFVAVVVIKREYLKEVGLLVLFVSLYLLLKLPQTEQFNYFISKFDGFILAGTILYLINRFGLNNYKEQYIKSLLWVGVLILIATLIYKFNLGFYDRQVRYFLNGPIVFGWMMGLMFFISLSEYFKSSRLGYLIFSAIFFFAVLWSESKGPVIALIAVFLLYVVIQREYRKTIYIAGTMILVLSLYSSLGYFNNKVSSEQSTRLISETVMVADGSYMSSNSFSLRVTMFHEAVYMFKNQPFLGVGVGNFGEHAKDNEITKRELYYPHNIFLEIVSEHGVGGLALFLIVFLYIFYKSDFFSRILFVFFGLCLSFSGDMAYWRFLVFVPIAFSGYQLYFKDERR